MALPSFIQDHIALPVLCAPMFIVSGPRLVVAQCQAGLIGSMPALSVRPAEAFEPALIEIRSALDTFRAMHPEARVAPFGINLISHASNQRLEHDLAACERQRVPLVITSLGASRAIVDRVHAYGGIVLHDVTNLRHARKAIAEGVDGLIAVAAGAGGHAGALHPFALLSEIREIFDGILVLSGAISDGRGVAAALALGADLAYMGTRFIATQEADAAPAYQQMILESTAQDICRTHYFTGVPGSYLRQSIVAAGLDPDDLPERQLGSLQVTDAGSKARAWKDIWSAGQGIGTIHDLPPVDMLARRMRQEFEEARHRLAAIPLATSLTA
ncbi:MAG: nitronate monooxygenase family protein [Ottowia sp.]|uniref:NAD(P)H-dependent flavin oxidoreductase n=1 Tax=Ottowia sp. TaxID=1898956 RepID=UPI003C747FAF